ncbi:hypothetical protein KZC51_05345 [Microbacterium sp. SSW1-49]|uniref:Uncharacterized protein n=1 Tax=Microbacterium croceum TaxID=2851645 RepID=A0ABT0FBX5_9MICO|nr:hypothetical protein [Microbacterium croceum]MCK2035559.1 hypothetical protein [Microbacterium croceum]
MATATPAITWGLDYDAAQFIPLPAAGEGAEHPDGARAWIDTVISHYESSAPLTDGDRQGLAVTAEALLTMIEPFVTRLWFAPPGVYSDVLVSVVVTDLEGDSAREIIAEVTASPESTASDGVAVETDSHGSGILVRRTTGVQPEDGRALLVAQWDLLLQNGAVLIAINAMGTTLPVFARLEEELMGLVEGIVLPAGSGADAQ